MPDISFRSLLDALPDIEVASKKSRTDYTFPHNRLCPPPLFDTCTRETNTDTTNIQVVPLLTPHSYADATAHNPFAFQPRPSNDSPDLDSDDEDDVDTPTTTHPVDVWDYGTEPLAAFARAPAPSTTFSSDGLPQIYSSAPVKTCYNGGVSIGNAYLKDTSRLITIRTNADVKTVDVCLDTGCSITTASEEWLIKYAPDSHRNMIRLDTPHLGMTMGSNVNRIGATVVDLSIEAFIPRTTKTGGYERVLYNLAVPVAVVDRPVRYFFLGGDVLNVEKATIEYSTNIMYMQDRLVGIKLQVKNYIIEAIEPDGRSLYNPEAKVGCWVATGSTSQVYR